MGREHDIDAPSAASEDPAARRRPAPPEPLRLVPLERGAPRRRSAARPSPVGAAAKPRSYPCRFCGGRWRDVDWFLYHPCVQTRFRALVVAEFQVDPDQARKCSPFSRARTRNLAAVKRDARAELVAAGRKRRHARRLPVVRAECPVQRPCGFVSCRHHNAFTVDEDNGSIKENLPQLRIMDDPEGPGLLVLEAVMGTCSLDTCDGQDDGSRGVNALQELREKAEAGRPIGDPENGMTLEETAKAMEISIERVRQIGAAAMRKVRLALWSQQEGRIRAGK